MRRHRPTTRAAQRLRSVHRGAVPSLFSFCFVSRRKLRCSLRHAWNPGTHTASGPPRVLSKIQPSQAGPAGQPDCECPACAYVLT